MVLRVDTLRMDDLFSRDVRSPSGFHVGIGGWTYAPWRGGAFYPPGLVQRRELEFASRQLTSIEINSTYYGAQKPAIYAAWRDATPEGFVFSAKRPSASSPHASWRLPVRRSRISSMASAIWVPGWGRCCGSSRPGVRWKRTTSPASWRCCQRGSTGASSGMRWKCASAACSPRNWWRWPGSTAWHWSIPTRPRIPTPPTCAATSSMRD